MPLIIDTSDKLMLSVLFGLSIGSIYTFEAGLLFIGINALLIYFFTGYKKLISSLWIKGEAIFIIMNTEIYGNRNIASFLKDRKLLKLFICWGTILFQLTFPLAIINRNILIFYLILGIIFHISIALIMKLHNFLYAFMATYPAIYFLGTYINQY